MKKLLIIIAFISINKSLIFSQCDTDEIKIKVEIETDDWGYETSWRITDLIGAILLEGGRDGTYGNLSYYTDSICVASDGCYFFEIYDTYGDGIFAPHGYKLFVDEVLVSSGSDDVGSYAKVTAYCPNICSITHNALIDLQRQLDGSIPLAIGDLNLIYNIFHNFPECLAISDTVILLAKNIIESYDASYGPLFTTPNTMYGFSKTPGDNPDIELARAIAGLEQGVFDKVFTPEVYAIYPQIINQWKFNSCTSFPGYIDPPLDSLLIHSTMILASFEDPKGMNPYYNINGDGTEHALRPTGFYLSPGSIARVNVPAELIGKDFYIRVGSHEWDLSNRPYFKRLNRISKKFEINSTSIEVFNPLGGAISILVPYGATEGIVQVSATNVVEAPFISLKSFHKTADIAAELNKPGPWAVFESENVMYTIPKHSIIPGQYNLIKTLQDWETAVRGVNSILARQIIPDKHNMYMIADVTIRFDAYSIGYPMSNTPLDYFNVPGPVYFINGPGPDDETNFHETGHALAMSMFPGEIEAIVNFPYVMAMNYGLNVDLNEAVKYSFVPNTFDIDKTATYRMVSNTFGTERNISNTTTDEVRYQHRGYGHYFEIVNLLGWCPLRNFWKQEYIDFKNGINHGTYGQDVDSRITRMSVAAQADLRPLLHVFGILPKDAVAVQESFDQLNIPKSLAIYKRLRDYMTLIPNDNADFINYALVVYPNLYTDGPNDDPDYGVGWHYLKSLTYDAAEAQRRRDILLSIMDLYFPDGEPEDFTDPDVCCMLDTLNVTLVSEDLIVSGGVEPYDISIDTVGNVITIRVTDYDGCESSVEYVISNLTEIAKPNLLIFPNPSNGDLQIRFGTNQSPVSISLFDQIGRLIDAQNILAAEIINYRLPEPEGIYFLHVRYADGGFSTSKIIKK